MSTSTDLYEQVGVSSEVFSASPHRLIQMLLEGALVNISKAKQHIQDKQVQQKCLAISKAIDIVMALRGCLDFSNDNEIAKSLDSLYEFSEHHLVLANQESSIQHLDEVVSVLVQIKSAWDQLPEQLNQ